jgi:hypothetical protein
MQDDTAAEAPSSSVASESKPCIFPAEILDMIVKEAGKSIVDEMKVGKINCRKLLGRFWNVMLTCKQFHWILCKWPVNSIVPTDEDGDCFDTIWIRKHPDIISFADWYRQYQWRQLQELDIDCISVARELVGNVHLSQYFSPGDVLNFWGDYHGKEEVIELLLRLSSYFDANKQPISETNPIYCNRFCNPAPRMNKTQFVTVGLINAVPVEELVDDLYDGFEKMFFSVDGWTYLEDHRINGNSVAPEVTEWWVWPSSSWPPDETLQWISGYCDGKAWVIEDTLMMYTNFGEPRSLIGKRERERLLMKSSPKR